jgi:hypothetical protein
LSLGQLVIAAATGAPHFTRGTTCADVMAVSAMRS